MVSLPKSSLAVAFIHLLPVTPAIAGGIIRSTHQVFGKRWHGMEKVVGPDGVEWTVRRWWWKTLPYETGFATLDALIFVIVLPFMLMWPFWLLAKWLGASWTILVERDGKQVAREHVRGWGASGRRIAELAAQARSGELAHLVPVIEPQ